MFFKGDSRRKDIISALESNIVILTRDRTLHCTMQCIIIISYH